MFYKNKDTKSADLSRRFLFVIWAVVLGSLVLAGGISAQTVQPSPTPDNVELGGYKVTSSIELGVRGKSLTGSDDKFRTDFNYKPGFRIFNSSFLMEDKEGKHKVFDSLLINSSGWGGDPSGFTRVNLEKTGGYRLTANIRKVSFFNRLNTYALGQHTQNTQNNMGDFDLKIFPQSEKLRLNFGYSYNRYTGPGTWTARPNSDEFKVNANNDAKSNDFRAGVEANVLGFNLGFTQGYRNFKDQSNLYLFDFSQGNFISTFTSVATGTIPTGVLTSYTKAMPIRGEAFYSVFTAQRTFAKKFDFATKFVYSDTSTKSAVFEVAKGTDASSTPNYVDSDTYDVTAKAKRPQFRGDVGLTFRVNDHLSISNTTSLDKFQLTGGFNSLRTLVRRVSTTNVASTTITNSAAYNFRDFRRITNTLEGDFQFNNNISAHLGYRYTERKEHIKGSLTATMEEEMNNTNTIIGGMKIKPMKNWVMYWDAESGTADNVFTKLDNYEFTNLRFRSRMSFNKFSLSFSAVSRQNHNPAQTNTGQFFGARVKSRIYSGNLDWTPRPELTLSSGYTYTHQTSFIDIVLPMGIAGNPQGTSLYLVRDHYAFFDVVAQPVKRLSLFASYRISKDLGQSDRVSPVVYSLINSYPMQLQSPEVRAAIRLTKNIDWNIGYQYFNYREKFQTTQDYRTHLPYTSLTIYFGGGDR